VGCGCEKVVSYLVQTSIEPTPCLYLLQNNYETTLFFHHFKKQKVKSQKPGPNCFQKPKTEGMKEER
jgi:hypothetical protein